MTTLVHTAYHEIVSHQAQATFAFSVAPLPDASGDPTLLRQVWSNLLSNAIKYTMPKDERRIEIGSRVETGMNVRAGACGRKDKSLRARRSILRYPKSRDFSQSVILSEAKDRKLLTLSMRGAIFATKQSPQYCRVQ